MRIIDTKTLQAVHSVTLLLTPGEAAELASKVRNLDAGSGAHVHVNDIDFRWELTVAIYTDQNLDGFREEVRRIIEEAA